LLATLEEVKCIYDPIGIKKLLVPASKLPMITIRVNVGSVIILYEKKIVKIHMTVPRIMSK